MTVADDRAEALRLLCKRALDRQPSAVARLVSVFQDRRTTAPHERAFVMQELAAEAVDAFVLGITGSPGSGKSSLIGRLAVELLRARPQLSVAVLAVDPSSHISGGALLGDRTRMNSAAMDDDRLYFRSEASDTELGGLSPSSFQVCRLLRRLYDLVIVETVGVGQSEGDIRHLADTVFLVMSPLGGDDVQFFKAGIIEIPDVFILNKSDEPSSDKTYHQLRSSLWLARPFDPDEVPIIRTSAKTGAGLDDLRDALLARVDAAIPTDIDHRDAHFLERWVRDEWGRHGVAHLRDRLNGPTGLLANSTDFDGAQTRFTESFAAALRH